MEYMVLMPMVAIILALTIPGEGLFNPRHLSETDTVGFSSDTGVSAGVGLQLGPGPVDLNPVTSIAGQATQDLDNTAGAIVDKLPLGLL
ncbi:hypothetical protein H0H93_011063 [Arthromyces matolae]|nr:hypothetical protein H0H93_011063 [Arthromyces matolae]